MPISQKLQSKRWIMLRAALQSHPEGHTLPSHGIESSMHVFAGILYAPWLTASSAVGRARTQNHPHAASYSLLWKTSEDSRAESSDLIRRIHPNILDHLSLFLSCYSWFSFVLTYQVQVLILNSFLESCVLSSVFSDFQARFWKNCCQDLICWFNCELFGI